MLSSVTLLFLLMSCNYFHTGWKTHWQQMSLQGYHCTVPYSSAKCSGWSDHLWRLAIGKQSCCMSMEIKSIAWWYVTSKHVNLTLHFCVSLSHWQDTKLSPLCFVWFPFRFVQLSLVMCWLLMKLIKHRLMWPVYWSPWWRMELWCLGMVDALCQVHEVTFFVGSFYLKYCLSWVVKTLFLFIIDISYC